jgi:putative transposase
MVAVAELAAHVGLRTACQAFSLNRGFVYRDRARRRTTVSRRGTSVRARPPLAFSNAEQDVLLGLLNSERFADMAPAAVYAILLDEGRYHGSIRTMYRLLAVQDQTGERRRQRVHPVYTKPELLAVRPGVTSVDIEVTTCPIFPGTSRVFADCDSLIVWDGLSETEGGGALRPWDSVGTGEA